MWRGIIYLGIIVSCVVEHCNGTYFYRPKHRLNLEHRQYMRYPRPVINPALREKIEEKFSEPRIDFNVNKLPHVHVTLEDEIYAHVHRYDGKLHIHRDPSFVAYGNGHGHIFQNHGRKNLNRRKFQPKNGRIKYRTKKTKTGRRIISKNNGRFENPGIISSGVFKSNSGLSKVDSGFPIDRTEKHKISGGIVKDNTDPDLVLIGTPNEKVVVKELPSVNIFDPIINGNGNTRSIPETISDFPDFNEPLPTIPTIIPNGGQIFPRVAGNSAVINSFIPDLLDPTTVFIGGVPISSNKEEEPLSFRPLEPIGSVRKEPNMTFGNDSLSNSSVNVPYPSNSDKSINIFIPNTSETQNSSTPSLGDKENTTRDQSKDNTTVADTNIPVRDMMVPSPKVRRINDTNNLLPDPLETNSKNMATLLPIPLSPSNTQNDLTFPLKPPSHDVLIPDPLVANLTNNHIDLQIPVVPITEREEVFIPNPIHPTTIPDSMTIPVPETRESVDIVLPVPINIFKKDQDSTNFKIPVPKISEHVVSIPDPIRSSYNDFVVIPTPMKLENHSEGINADPTTNIDYIANIDIPNPITRGEETNYQIIPDPQISFKDDFILPQPSTQNLEYNADQTDRNPENVYIPSPMTRNPFHRLIPDPPLPEISKIIQPLPVPMTNDVTERITPQTVGVSVDIPDPLTFNVNFKGVIPDPLAPNHKADNSWIPSPVIPSVKVMSGQGMDIPAPINVAPGTGRIIFPKPSTWSSDKSHLDNVSTLPRYEKEKQLIPEPVVSKTKVNDIIPDPIGINHEKPSMIPDPEISRTESNVYIPNPLVSDKMERIVIPIPLLSDRGDLSLPDPITGNEKLSENDVLSIPNPITRNEKLSENDVLFLPDPITRNENLSENDVLSLPDPITRNEKLSENDVLSIPDPITRNEKLSENGVLSLPDPIKRNEKLSEIDVLSLPNPITRNEKLSENDVLSIPDPITRNEMFGLPIPMVRNKEIGITLPNPIIDNGEGFDNLIVPISPVITSKLIILPQPLSSVQISHITLLPTPLTENDERNIQDKEFQSISDVHIPSPITAVNKLQTWNETANQSKGIVQIPVPITADETHMPGQEGKGSHVIIPKPMTEVEDKVTNNNFENEIIIPIPRTITKQNPQREDEVIPILNDVNIPTPNTMTQQNTSELFLPTPLTDIPKSNLHREFGKVIIPNPKTLTPNDRKNVTYIDKVDIVTPLTKVLHEKQKEDLDDRIFDEVKIPIPMKDDDRQNNEEMTPKTLSDVVIPNPVTITQDELQKPEVIPEPVTERETLEIISTGYIDDNDPHSDLEITAASRKRQTTTTTERSQTSTSSTTTNSPVTDRKNKDSQKPDTRVDDKLSGCNIIGCPVGFVCVKANFQLCQADTLHDTCGCRRGCSVSNTFIAADKSGIVDECGSTCFCPHSTGKAECSFKSCSDDNNSTNDRRKVSNNKGRTRKPEGISNGGIIYVPVPTKNTDDITNALKDASKDWSNTGGISMGGIIYVPHPSRPRRRQNSGISKGGIIYVPLRPTNTKEVTYALEEASRQWSRSKGISRGGIIRIPVTTSKDDTGSVLRKVTYGWDQITGISKGGVIYIPLPTSDSTNTTTVLEEVTYNWQKSTGISRGGIIYVPVPTSEISDKSKRLPSRPSGFSNGGIIYVPLITRNTNVSTALKDATSNLSKISGISMGGIIYIPMNKRKHRDKNNRDIVVLPKRTGITRGGFINVPVPRRSRTRP